MKHSLYSIQSETQRPTINHQLRPRHIPPRPPTTQQNHRPRNLLHISHPPHRASARPHIPHHHQILPRIQHRVHIPRRHTVHPNPVHGPLRRQVLRQVRHGGFAHVVRGLRLREVGGVRGDRRREEDTSAVASIVHVASSGLGAQERAGEVDVDDFFELVGWGGEGGDAADDAGEAAEDVDCGHQVLRLDECGGDGTFGGYVDGEGVDWGLGEGVFESGYVLSRGF